MAFKITPLDGLSSLLSSLQGRIAAFCGEGGGLYKLYTESWFGSSIRSAFLDVASKLLSVCSDIRSVNGKIQELDTFLDGKLTILTNSINALPGIALTYASNKAQEVRDELVSFANNEVRPRLNATEARLNGIRDRAGAEWNSIATYATQAAQGWSAMVQADLNTAKSRLPTRTPAELAAYFKNLARPGYEESWEFFIQNSLWNLRNKVEGSLEWDVIVGEATAKANAALAAANENLSKKVNITDFDAKLAAIIEDLGRVDKRQGDLDNKLPLATDALNKRIDEANQSATDKANAALAAANLNIQGVRDKVTGELDDHDSRIRKMEMEIEKVAPVLSRLPRL